MSYTIVPKEKIELLKEMYPEVLELMGCKSHGYMADNHLKFNCPFCGKETLTPCSASSTFLMCINQECDFNDRANVIEIYKRWLGYDSEDKKAYYVAAEELIEKLNITDDDVADYEEEPDQEDNSDPMQAENLFGKLSQHWLSVPTKYKGIAMASKHEASFAFLLDIGGITRWHYEPVFIELPSGEIYHPDFWVENMPFLLGQKIVKIDTWVEVKGFLGDERLRKPHEFSESEFVYVFGLRPTGDTLDDVFKHMISQNFEQIVAGAPIPPFSYNGIMRNGLYPAVPYISQNGTLAFGDPIIISHQSLGKDRINGQATMFAFDEAWNIDFLNCPPASEMIRGARITIQKMLMESEMGES